MRIHFHICIAPALVRQVGGQAGREEGRQAGREGGREGGRQAGREEEVLLTRPGASGF